MQEFILPLISSAVTSGITWLLTRRKYIAEVNTVDIKSMQESLKFYVDMVEDNKKRIDEYQNEVRELRQEKNELSRKVQELELKLIKYETLNANTQLEKK